VKKDSAACSIRISMSFLPTEPVKVVEETSEARGDGRRTEEFVAF
jgi:hypothetical protein